MLQLLIDALLARWPDLVALRELDKITPRAVLSAVAGFVLALWLGPRMIIWLQAHFREPIKSASADVARLHQCKQATPTMGGIFIVAAVIGVAIALGDLSSPYLWVAVLLAAALGLLGACDDLIKLTTARRGVSAKTKLLWQSAIALGAAILVYRMHIQIDHGVELALPLTQGSVPLGWLFIPLATLVIVASSNAVNVTDGLDGLAGGCLICATGAMALVVYASGHAEWARYLNITHVAGAGETVVIAAAMVGGVLGFLWFNCHPASVFMGNTGALPLGGLLGLLAVIARQEILLIVIGGVFVVEAGSVIVQVGWFRWKRKRVFLCAPLHHHFQLKGWPEGKIVVRFWIAAALCAIVGLAGLKLRPNELLHQAQLDAIQQLTRREP